MKQVDAGLVGADVGELVKGGDLHPCSIASIAALEKVGLVMGVG